MPTPQSGVLPEGSAHALFLTFNLRDRDVTGVRTALARAPELTREVAGIDPGAGLLSAVGVGAVAWDRLYGEPRPTLLRPFIAHADGARTAPATGADILLHIRSARADLNHELGSRLYQLLTGGVDVVEEISGFRYLDARDLTGFVDGTENPQGDDRAAVALVADGDPAFAGGSYVSMQRYIHALDRWRELAVPAQEAIIGRTKPDDIELGPDQRPPTAHVSRADLSEGGEKLELLRHSMPYGTPAESGLVFIAYAKDPDRFDKILAHMVETDADGHHDHLLDYTRAVTGVSFFVPSEEFLERG